MDRYFKSTKAHFYLKLIKESNNNVFGRAFTINAEYWGRNGNLYLGQMNLYKADTIEITKEEFENEFDKFCSIFKNS